ncbi:hypothetical protein BgiBS90_031483, partial [Biomphalaria glabrata]
ELFTFATLIRPQLHRSNTGIVSILSRLPTTLWHKRLFMTSILRQPQTTPWLKC